MGLQVLEFDWNLGLHRLCILVGFLSFGSLDYLGVRSAWVGMFRFWVPCILLEFILAWVRWVVGWWYNTDFLHFVLFGFGFVMVWVDYGFVGILLVILDLGFG